MMSYTPETILVEMRRLREERDHARLAGDELARVAYEWWLWYRRGEAEWVDPPAGMPEALARWELAAGRGG